MRRLIFALIVAVVVSLPARAMPATGDHARAALKDAGYVWPGGGTWSCPQCTDCDFCLSGWHFVWAENWYYFDPTHEYTDHYIEHCDFNGCYHECTAVREMPGGNITSIFSCYRMVGSCYYECCY